MAQERSVRAIKRRGKKRGSVTYSSDQENEVSKIFIANEPAERRREAGEAAAL